MIDKNYDKASAHFKKLLRTDKCFDVVVREVVICNKRTMFLFVDGFIKDSVFEKVLEFFYSINNQEFMATPDSFSKNGVPYCEVSISPNDEDIVTQILSGVTCCIVEGFDRAILLDMRSYPQRENSEPQNDKVFRGSRDGFIETMVMNCALIRRRIRSREFTTEIHNIGSISKTDVCVCYMNDKVDKKLLQNIQDKLSKIKIESLTMNQETLCEELLKHKWYNPFPRFKYTERPDAAAAQILEGDIVILVDNSPSAIIVPSTIFDIMEEANDYYFPILTGSYLRLSRFLVSFLTIFLTPLWLMLLKNPNLIPPAFSFIQLSEPANISVFWQLIILEIAIDGLKLASLNTPDMLTTSLSVIAGIVVGDFAVNSGWFSSETMLYMALVAIANYNQPNFELSYAFKYMRIMLLVLTAVFSLWGFIAGIVLMFLILLKTETLSGKSYLYPFVPFDAKELKKKLFRVKISE